jgi:methyl-accepting chemotaxis protein/DNA-binding LacI/PurR family transcriptional regulator
VIARHQHISRLTAAIADGDLTVLQTLDDSGAGPERHIRFMLAELEGLIAKARNYTNQILRAGSQINSITTQGIQDNKVVTARITDISQSIHRMATNIQHAVEYIREQSGLLGNSSSSIEQTMQSIHEIGNIASLKGIMEKTAPSSLASERTAFSLDLLYEATQAIEHDANTCVQSSQKAAEDAEEGKLAIHQTIDGIRLVERVMTEFFEILRRLGERAEEVNEILEVISDIADHTNLLAINAAIISAHAGEHGRDFAVIADEIGKFAERTSDSTSEIEELLRAIQTEIGNAAQAMEKSSKAVTAGVELSSKAGKSLEKIGGSIFSTKEGVSRIALATRQQSQENERIRAIMTDLVASQTEKQEQVRTVLWQLSQTVAQVQGITSEQAEGSARIAAVVGNIDRIARDIAQTAQQHLTTAEQTIDAMNYIRKLVQRMTLGTEKTVQLTDELFTQGGNLALTMGEFVLSDRALPDQFRPDMPSIGFVRRSDDLFFDDIGTGIRKEAEPYGFQIIEIDSRYEATTQVEDLSWLLRYPRLQGIILCPVDIAVGEKLVRKALEHQIACVAADETISATLSVRSGNREGGRRAADIFQRRLPAKALIGAIVDRTTESMIRRLEGFRQQAEEYGFEVVEISCDVSDHEHVRKDILSSIEENPDLKGLFLSNETVTSGYLSLLHERRLPATQALAVGYDRSPIAEEAIRNGSLLGAIFQHPEEIGKQAFHYLHRLLNKEIRVEDFEERTIYIPTVQVTQDTVKRDA